MANQNDQQKLRKLVNQMDINRTNFIILVSEVVNYYLQKNIPHNQIFNKATENLKLFLNDLKDLSQLEKLYLESQIPNRVNSLLVLIEKKQNPKTQSQDNKIHKSKSFVELSKSRSSLVSNNDEISFIETNIDSIIVHIYSKIVKLITIKDFNIFDFTNHIIDISETVIKMVNEFTQLNSIEKKRLVIKIFNMILDNSNQIFVDMRSEDIEFLKMTIQEIPDLIDIILLMINSPININPEIKNFFTKKLNILCKCCRK